jgi:sulfur-oxidizing protein SoxZ
MRVLLNVPKTAKRGEAIPIKILISHPMESGQRRDEMGKLVPRMVINDFHCEYNGVEVIHLALFPAIAANPFLAFAARADATGDLVFRWKDDSGAAQTETAHIEVT